MKEDLELLAEQGLPVLPQNPDPVVTIRNKPKQAVAWAIPPPCARKRIWRDTHLP
jgi:hypothetical protein